MHSINKNVLSPRLYKIHFYSITIFNIEVFLNAMFTKEFKAINHVLKMTPAI